MWVCTTPRRGAGGSSSRRTTSTGGGDAKNLLAENRRRIHRVYLLTGETDEVAPNTLRVADILKETEIPHKVRIAPGMGHEVPGDRMRSTYRRPLAWLLAHPASRAHDRSDEGRPHAARCAAAG